MKMLIKNLTSPCKGCREIPANTKERWKQKEQKAKGAHPTLSDLEPLIDLNFTGGTDAVHSIHGPAKQSQEMAYVSF